MAKHTHIVSGDIGPFTADQVLTTDKEIADYFRVLLDYDKADKTQAPDADILAHYTNVVRADDTLSEEDIEARFEETWRWPPVTMPAINHEVLNDLKSQAVTLRGIELHMPPKKMWEVYTDLRTTFDDTPEDVLRGLVADELIRMQQEAMAASDANVALVSSAKTAAEQVDSQSELSKLNSALDDIARRPEEAATAPIEIAVLLERTYGTGKIKGWPRPGLKREDIPAGSNERPDIWKDADKKRHSWYQEFFLDLSIGSEYRQELRHLKDSKLEPMPSTVPDRIRQMTSAFVGAEIHKYEQRIRAGTKVIGDATKIIMQIEACKEACNGNVEIGYQWDGKPWESKIFRTTKPIWVGDAHNRGMVKVYGVSEFLRFRPDFAATKGGTYAALIDSPPKRDTTGDQGGESKEDAIPEIKNVRLLETAVYKAFDFVDMDGVDFKKTEIALAKRLAEKDGDEFLLTLVDFSNSLNTLVAPYVHRAVELNQANAGAGNQQKKKTG